MKRWGLIVTAFYFVVVALLVPVGVYLAGGGRLGGLYALFGPASLIDGGWIGWLIIAVIVSAQALLLNLAASHATVSFDSAGPTVLDGWRARIAYGSLPGRSCLRR